MTQGQGFIADTKINFVSYIILLFTLEISILLSSNGSLKASKIDFEKCGNSSKNKIPLLLKAISPIFAFELPLTVPVKNATIIKKIETSNMFFPITNSTKYNKPCYNIYKFQLILLQTYQKGLKK